MNEQTTDTREEVELPPLPEYLRYAPPAALEERERQLRASILACKKAEAANREKDAELTRQRERCARLIEKTNNQRMKLHSISVKNKWLKSENANINDSRISSAMKAERALVDYTKLEAELASLRASVGETWDTFGCNKPAYGEVVEVLFSGPCIALCHLEREELADDDMRPPQDILWDDNADQERTMSGAYWRKFAPPTKDKE